MLAGQISSSCIPLVDVRDVAGNLVHGNFLMSGISLAGLIPYGGDIAKAGSKLSRFVLKNLDNVPEIAKASRFLLENCPDLVKGLSKSDEFVAAMKKLGESDLGRLTKAEREALEEFYDAANRQGKIYRIEGKNGIINSYEYGKIEEYLYHEVYSDGFNIFDPRYSNVPVPKDDYFRMLKDINIHGFKVFERIIE